jgi:hypothetical protein
MRGGPPPFFRNGFMEECLIKLPGQLNLLTKISATTWKQEENALPSQQENAYSHGIESLICAHWTASWIQRLCLPFARSQISLANKDQLVHSENDVRSAEPREIIGLLWESYATSRRVAGSIPDDVIGLFQLTYSFQLHYGPGVESASNRNEYQKSSRW